MNWPELGAGLHLFVFDGGRAEVTELGRCRCWLSPQELTRASQYRFDAHRREYMAGKVLTRLVLGHYTRQAPEAVRFHEGPYGKPALCGDAGLHFNLSHSGGVNVLAISRLGPVGVDVERVDRQRDLSTLIERFFAPAEWQTLRSTVEPQRQQLAWSLWTMKEALAKALGHGLSMPLDACAFSFAGDVIHLDCSANQPASGLDWQLGQHVLPQDMLLAWALNARHAPALVAVHEVLPNRHCLVDVGAPLRRGSALAGPRTICPA